MIDLSKDEVLFTKDSNKKVHPASTMKIATLLLAERKLRGRLDEEVTITKEMISAVPSSLKKEKKYRINPHLIETNSSHAGLKAGERIKVRDLFAAAMIVSANDACNALAITSSGSAESFVRELNALVKQLGCNKTHFVNAHGLFHPEHVTTARDLATIALAVRKNGFLMELAGKKTFSRPKTNLQSPVTYAATNTLLRSSSPDYYSKAYGLKTGFTTDSGAHLIAMAKDQKRDLLVVALQCGKNSKAKVKSVFDFFFSETRQKKLIAKAKSPLFKHSSPHLASMLHAYVLRDFYVDLFPSQDKAFKVRVQWDSFMPPVAKEQVVGQVQVIDSTGKVYEKANLYAHATIGPSLAFRIKNGTNHLCQSCATSKSYPLVLATVIAAATLVFMLLRFKRVR